MDGKNSTSFFVFLQRRLEKIKMTFKTREQTSYVLDKQRQQHGTGQRIVCQVKHILTKIHRLH